ncbi:hypothetical protein [Bradyrhizobium sp. SRS-191]|uniref:hypothetical protein n=1 Tax=Bradyrhizobium sp. SRS-191 TaxID=2962606 RepID=UPI00211F294F|nr:hypothetical protein [Bradyrhizobium sp. SRS-191]
MTNHDITASRRMELPDAPSGSAPARASGEIVRGVDFRAKRRERIYDPERIWSGEHTVQDYTEL